MHNYPDKDRLNGTPQFLERRVSSHLITSHHLSILGAGAPHVLFVQGDPLLFAVQSNGHQGLAHLGRISGQIDETY